MSLVASAVSGLVSVAPEIAGWLGGEKAEKTAEDVANVAKKVTGQEDPQAAVDAIKQDPEQARKFKEALQEYKLEMERERTKQLTQINQTMRSAYKESGWKSGWRPFFGYVFGVSWGLTFFGLLALIGYATTLGLSEAIELAGKLPQLVAAMTPLFGMGLKVLGVQIRQRSRDKRLASGVVDPPEQDWMDKLGAMFGKRKKETNKQDEK